MALMMTVSGIRGIIGETMTPTLAAELGATFGSHLGGGEVIVGRDSRPSGEMVHAALVSGLLATGCRPIDLGIVATPTVGLMVLHHKAAGGVVLTASHNPIVWNGVKFITARGFAPPKPEAESILQRYREKRFVLVPVESIGRIERDTTANETHVTRVLKVVDVEAIRAKRFKVVLDSVNGAGGPAARLLLDRLGCSIEHLNGDPTGHFAHTPEPIAENLTGLCDAMRRAHAHVGFAQDPDADRLAIVDETGRYIGEEYTLALAAKFVFSRTCGTGFQPVSAAANLSTSRMIDDLAAAAKAGPVHRTAVGEANVAEAMLRERCVIAGEGNGGVIDPRIVPIRDSLISMALVLNLLAVENKPLSQIVAAMPRYAMVKRKFELPREKIDAWLSRVRELGGGMAAALSGHASCGTGFQPVSPAQNSGAPRMNDADGIRLDWPEGWVHLRASNTEPIARVIAEARDESAANLLVSRITSLQP